MGRIGGGELLLILLIALLIFGPSKLAGMGKGLGEGLKNFKKGLSHDDTDDEPKAAEPSAPAPPEPPKALTAGDAPAAQPPTVLAAGAAPAAQPPPAAEMTKPAAA